MFWEVSQKRISPAMVHIRQKNTDQGISMIIRNALANSHRAPKLSDIVW